MGWDARHKYLLKKIVDGTGCATSAAEQACTPAAYALRMSPQAVAPCLCNPHAVTGRALAAAYNRRTAV